MKAGAFFEIAGTLIGCLSLLILVVELIGGNMAETCLMILGTGIGCIVYELGYLIENRSEK